MRSFGLPQASSDAFSGQHSRIQAQNRYSVVDMYQNADHFGSAFSPA
jgi:hypothetical protein